MNRSPEATAKLHAEFLTAVELLNREEVYRLLRLGVNINTQNKAGDSPLHQCIKDGKLDSVKLLVDFGADITLPNRDGWSPMHVATFLGYRDMMLYLLMNGR
ncbi:notch-regulated ankyrin repeat-containing protein isoform X2 [Nematostella vectensis]|uniref:notch-regulated ankyrin repeat-containing protein isoform X2 n=1 Tax=Nematostella vectensis TaxID=45351 RepID=UPI00138FC899|nr:notch-regulated ankyrin repeat-containing protein isoform X2 [Nematostella vectensis]